MSAAAGPSSRRPSRGRAPGGWPCPGTGASTGSPTRTSMARACRSRSPAATARPKPSPTSRPPAGGSVRRLRPRSSSLSIDTSLFSASFACRLYICLTRLGPRSMPCKVYRPLFKCPTTCRDAGDI
uniref:Uncharacterized protein n=1 Tax=Zea mays TaxID=4577 RepID=B4FN87_MAIZE|nr:unknown [Zea mays]